MQLKTTQEVGEISTFPPSPARGFQPFGQIIEIELQLPLSTGRERHGAFILAELAESVGNCHYHKDPTLEKLAIALSWVVDGMIDIDVNFDLALPGNAINSGLPRNASPTFDSSHLERLQHSFAEIEAAIERLQDFRDSLKDQIEDAQKSHGKD